MNISELNSDASKTHIHFHMTCHYFCPVLNQTNVRGVSQGILPFFGRTFIRLNYINITKNTYIRGATFTEIMTRENIVFFGGGGAIPCTVHLLHDVLSEHFAGPLLSR